MHQFNGVDMSHNLCSGQQAQQGSNTEYVLLRHVHHAKGLASGGQMHVRLNMVWTGQHMKQAVCTAGAGLTR